MGYQRDTPLETRSRSFHNTDSSKHASSITYMDAISLCVGHTLPGAMYFPLGQLSNIDTA